MARKHPTDPNAIGRRATLLPTARDQSLVGKPATVRKVIKTRGEYLLHFDNGQHYRAFACNVSFMDA